jgi:hypothetical protein
MPSEPISDSADTKPDAREVASKAGLGATSELLFVVLPFIVIAITLGHLGAFRTFLYIPEWSIVSAVIAGQSIVKFASLTMGRRVDKEFVVLWLSVLLVCLLVPVLITLAIVLTSVEVSISLAVAQAILFILSAGAFWTASFFETMAKLRPIQ